jgi:hypothetical protein
LVKTRPRTAPTSLLRTRRGGHLEIRVLRLVFRKMTMPVAGQTRTSSLGALPPSADIGPGGQPVGWSDCFRQLRTPSHTSGQLWAKSRSCHGERSEVQFDCDFRSERRFRKQALPSASQSARCHLIG